MGSNPGLAIFFLFFSQKWDKKWVLACQSFGEQTDFNQFYMSTISQMFFLLKRLEEKLAFVKLFGYYNFDIYFYKIGHYFCEKSVFCWLCNTLLQKWGHANINYTAEVTYYLATTYAMCTRFTLHSIVKMPFFAHLSQYIAFRKHEEF